MTQEDRDIRISSALAILLLSIFLGMLINTIITPTIEDYIHGKVRVEINQKAFLALMQLRQLRKA